MMMPRDDPVPACDPNHPTVEMLIWAYRHGIFPMADPESGDVEWYCPNPRGVLPLDAFHIPKNLRKLVRQQRFRITTDQAFEDVMRACAAPRRDDQETWISDALIDAYVSLHRQSFAHSIEAWHGDTIVGGLYGVHIGGVFFGESMFTRPDLGGSGASKVCLFNLVMHMRRRGFAVLDTQFHNDHLDQFGCIEVPRDEYLISLAPALKQCVSWLPFEPAQEAFGNRQ